MFETDRFAESWEDCVQYRKSGSVLQRQNKLPQV